ncbi:TetR/AcrR family transcriptional regulator [Lichenicoccus roseus]|uniref:TetR/AcrR family transcriptional regulator n=1 Tax=Lichenicoccus roseus TaxID=2683649 RepID=A0A5R9J919_9PROT|nr:TetR/AcrR family transcriptional regulator [Lichenicoccus roseus]TLU74085.1 TetR/AcrR family transcriptional regulator [Lichenicoccus roseus]
MGRPREFDVDVALAAALDVFWRNGFEGASMTDLTEAMGITRPSLYATYGNKEALFRRALDSYQSTCMTFFADALSRPTARMVAERILFGWADAQTDPAHPAGCLGTNGALACSNAAEPIRLELVARREAAEAALRRRLEQAVAEGDLPPDADPAALASYVMTVGQGMAVQAASGSTRALLYRVVDTALRAWPAGTEAADRRVDAGSGEEAVRRAG